MKLKIVLLMLLLLVSPSIAQVDSQDSPEALLGVAESLITEELYREAKNLAQEVLQIEPENIRAKWVIAKASLSLGEFQDAQSQANDLMRADPTDPGSQSLQGTVYLLQKQADKAIPFLEKALQLAQQDEDSPELAASYANTLVLAHHQNGNPEKALEVCLQALKDNPQDRDLHLSCSRLYREAKNYQAALDVARLGLEVAPDFTNLYASVALAEAGLGHRQRSEAAYQKVRELDPELAKGLRSVLDGLHKDAAEYQLKFD